MKKILIWLGVLMTGVVSVIVSIFANKKLDEYEKDIHREWEAAMEDDELNEAEKEALNRGWTS